MEVLSYSLLQWECMLDTWLAPTLTEVLCNDSRFRTDAQILILGNLLQKP
jgi:hypothetical protein